MSDRILISHRHRLKGGVSPFRSLFTNEGCSRKEQPSFAFSHIYHISCMGPRKKRLSKFPGRTSAPYSEPFLPFSLIHNRTDDFGASFALLGRKALQPFPQTFTTAPAKHCDLCLKRLPSLPQTLALFASNACPLCLKRLREKAPSLRIPFLPCSPH